MSTENQQYGPSFRACKLYRRPSKTEISSGARLHQTVSAIGSGRSITGVQRNLVRELNERD